MHRTTEQLRNDALAIWRAGLTAVAGDRLVREAVRVEGSFLILGDERLDLDAIGRIAVVGAGKAGAGMARGLEQALGSPLMAAKQLAGWINVPDHCVEPLERITLHGARPSGRNEPTPAGVEGTRQIVQIVESLGPADLCLCLLSGGGSALLPAPVPGITLEDKQALTRFLSGAGANIEQLNIVRKQLSQIKGGRLARACRAGTLITLVISDVLGDPLDIIASGPTEPDGSRPADALEILNHFGARQQRVAPAAFDVLERAAREPAGRIETTCRTRNLIIGNNATAVDAAGIEAERRGYSHAMHVSGRLEGSADDVGRRLAHMAAGMRGGSGPDCLITGGEPVVELVAESERGRGGRNQQLVLAALVELASGAPEPNPLDGILLLSAGTDGEDGPTDAAGAWIDGETVARARSLRLDPLPFLQRNDAYSFFAALESLVVTGPTHTNVCDIRVITVSRP